MREFQEKQLEYDAGLIEPKECPSEEIELPDPPLDESQWENVEKPAAQMASIADAELSLPQIPISSHLAGHEFLSSMAKLLINEENEFQDRLDALFKLAQKISLSIWTRKSNVVCSFAEDLKDTTYVEDCSQIIPHDLFLSGDISTLIGRKMTVLVHPLIEAYGNEDGDDYANGRILSAAVGWYHPRLAENDLA